MNIITSHIFLFFACILLINSLLLYLSRRLKLSDYIAHILTGTLFSAMLIFWSHFIDPTATSYYEKGIMLPSASLEAFETTGTDSTVLTGLRTISEKAIYGEKAFLDSLNLAIGKENTALLGNLILKEIAIEENITVTLITFLTSIGLVLFFMQLGFNFDPLFLASGQNQNVLYQVVLILVLNIGILGSCCYFFVLNKQLMPVIFLVGAFTSLSIGAVLTSHLPMKTEYKIPFAALVKTAAFLDILAICLFSGVMIVIQQQKNAWRSMDEDIFYWIALILITVPILLSKYTDRLFEYFRHWIGEYVFVLKIGLIFLFLYAGFHVQMPLILLGLWIGYLMKFLFNVSRMEIKEKFFSITSFFYILPFVEIGRSLLQPGIFDQSFGIQLSIILLALICATLLLGALNFFNKKYPLVMEIGAFPRGEITVLLLWVFKTMQIISTPVFVLGVVAALISSLLGSIAGRLILVYPGGKNKKLKIS